MTINNLNDDQTTRDTIIGLESVPRSGGTKRFRHLTLTQLNELINNNFIDLEDAQNSAPSVAEFYEFMKDHPEVEAHGYAVDKSRSDYRVLIEGLKFNGSVSMPLMLDFVKLCRYADEFVCETNRLYSWWD